MCAVCAALAICGVIAAPTLAVWTAGTGIQDVGEVTKTSPTGANSTILHYGGTGSAETAKFAIDVSAAKDWDLCNGGPLEEDAGLHEEDTDWLVPAGAGDIDDDLFTTTFTPGNDVKSGITVKCRVYEGHSRSWSDGNFDPYVEKQYAGTLTTFMVRMLVQPGNKIFKEDELVGTKQFGFKTNAPLSLAGIDWTGILAMPDATPVPPQKGENVQAITWQTLAESDNGLVGGIRGTISFTPYITIDGKVRYGSTTAGLHPPGDLGNVVAGFAAAYNPYVGATVLFSTWAMGSKPHTNYGVIGESVIENGEGPVPQIDRVGSVMNTPYPWTLNDVDLSALSITVAQTAGVQSFTVRGSYEMRTQLQCYDDSFICEITATLRTAVGDPHGYARWGSSRPTYTRP